MGTAGQHHAWKSVRRNNSQAETSSRPSLMCSICVSGPLIGQLPALPQCPPPPDDPKSTLFLICLRSRFGNSCAMSVKSVPKWRSARKNSSVSSLAHLSLWGGMQRGGRRDEQNLPLPVGRKYLHQKIYIDWLLLAAAQIPARPPIKVAGQHVEAPPTPPSSPLCSPHAFAPTHPLVFFM